jgi:hypothetical protein
MFEVGSIQKTLFTFQQQLVHTKRAVASAQRINPVTTLLPYCSTNPPIPEHVRNILSDVCKSIPDIAQAATTQDGQWRLRQWLPDTGVAEDIIGFWEQEFMID